MRHAAAVRPARCLAAAQFVAARCFVSLLCLTAVLACTPAGADGSASDGEAEAGEAVVSEAVAAVGTASDSPVLLELFTSQGCSSCPPADRLLSALAADPDLAGRVLPLAYHVDYWNYIGWTDPFSEARWSERQRRYAEELPSGRVYTPQLVVDGRSHLVGSRRADALQEIRKALDTPPAGRLELTVGEPAGGLLPVTVAATLEAEPDADGQPLTVWLALWQDGLVTPVSRGENADRVLRDDRVVRRLVRVLELPSEPGATAQAATEIPLDDAWDLSKMGVVAFLQAPSDLAIHGAAGAPISPGG